MLRYRGSKSALENVKELDAFPKVPEAYVETSTQGGAISICTFLFISVLVLSEIHFYFNTSFKYSYAVDHNFNEKIWLNFDITIASMCHLVGADVLDVTGKAFVYMEEVKEERCKFELTQQEEKKRSKLAVEKYRLLEDNNGNKLSERALKHGVNSETVFLGGSETKDAKDSDACRFYGSIEINKVSGNFHITAGKPIAIGGSHAHIQFLTMNTKYNFSHRINHFSFGNVKTGFINPLDGDEVLSNEENIVYNYYISVVPTKIRTYRLTTDSFQYSVTEQSRGLSHTSGSQGMPGVFFKYDFTPLSVTIQDKGMPTTRFLVRLCGIIGGVFATSAVLNGLISMFLSYFQLKIHQNSSKDISDGSKASLLPPAVSVS